MKNLGFLVLILLVALAGCSSTSPALKAVVVENLNMSQSSYESESTIKVKTNALDFVGAEEVPAEIALLLKVLEEGLVLDVKQKDSKNMYMKLGLNNAEALKVSSLWTHENDPEVELYAFENELFFKTSTEDQFFHVDFNEEIAASGISQDQITSLNTFFNESFIDYVQQFDYELANIENKGTKQVQTPGGTKSANHIHVVLTLDDIKDFISYTLGNLAEYDQLDAITLEYFKLVSAGLAIEEEMTLTDEEVVAMVEEFKAMLLEFKAMVDQFDAEQVAAEYGFKPTVNVELDFYVTNKAELVKDTMKLDVTLEMLDLPPGVQMDPIQIAVELENVYWNVKGAVELPAFDAENVYDMMAITSDYAELQKVNEDSIVRQIIESTLFSRFGTLQVGSTDAFVHYEPVTLDSAPYIENGHTLVPVKVVADIARTEAVWNGATKEVTFEVNGNEVVVKIGSTTAYVNGEPVEMSVAPVIKNNRTFVPLRFISENLGAHVEWYQESKMIDIQF